jgi:uncharacterized protein (DUF58 family)
MLITFVLRLAVGGVALCVFVHSATVSTSKNHKRGLIATVRFEHKCKKYRYFYPLRFVNYIGHLYIHKIWYFLLIAIVVLFCSAYFVPQLFTFVLSLAYGFFFLTMVDYVLLFFVKGRVSAERAMAGRFGLGDENEIIIHIQNTYPFNAYIQVIDEIPVQQQVRDFLKKMHVRYRSQGDIRYSLRPLTRGEYQFGNVICYVSSPLRLLQRRFNTGTPTMVKVYPSYKQLKKHLAFAMSANTLTGSKKVRRIGHSMEFEKIKDYVHGDDVRSINWKATARSSNIMVNVYTDARQQQIYCLIDKSRNMKMPFDGMTLLDYAINASLALLNVVLVKDDKAGLVTFSNKVNDFIPAEKRHDQLYRIQETLYRQQTEFKESDYEALWIKMHHGISQRSLLLLFTNFETLSSLSRQLPFLRKLAQRHLVCVIFFQNTLLKKIHESYPDTLEGIYVKTIADHFDYEKRQIVKELRHYGILSILTTPEMLTTDVINRYLELKAQQMV